MHPDDQLLPTGGNPLLPDLLLRSAACRCACMLLAICGPYWRALHIRQLMQA